MFWVSRGVAGIELLWRAFLEASSPRVSDHIQHHLVCLHLWTGEDGAQADELDTAVALHESLVNTCAGHLMQVRLGEGWFLGALC